MASIESVFRISRKGQIASLLIDAVVSESHTRAAAVSDFPVEDGVTISDHVKLEPISLDVNGFISDAPVAPLGSRVVGDAIRSVRNAFLPGRFDDDDDVPNAESRSPLDAWEYLNKVWRDRNLIIVVSSLQIYRNMILTSLVASKTPQIGKSLEFRASLREVRILQGATGTFPAFKIKTDAANAAKTRGQSKAKKGKETVKQTTVVQAVKPQSALAALTGLFGG